jgi:hypothetical protein
LWLLKKAVVRMDFTLSAKFAFVEEELARMRNY